MMPVVDVRLGRVPHDPARVASVPRLRTYLRGALPLPDACEYAPGIALPMWGNDAVGDCTMCSAATLLAVWTAIAAGAPLILAEADVVGAYAALTGYKAGDPSTDRGAQEPDVVRFLQSDGIGGHAIDAHAYVDPTDTWALRSGIWLMGGLSLDLALPKTARDQVESGTFSLVGDPTDSASDAAPYSWGGHEAAACGYSRDGLFIRTWSRRIFAPWNWLNIYLEGAWALRSCDWVGANGRLGSGVDVAAWDADMAAIASPAEEPSAA